MSVKVRFLADHVTQTRPEDQERFEAGKVYELAEASAKHHTRRGHAERVDSIPADDQPSPKKAPRKRRATSK